MIIEINKSPGWRNDLLISIPRREVEDVRFQIASRERLMNLPGLLRHRRSEVPETREAVGQCKKPIHDHLRLLNQDRTGLLDQGGTPIRPFLVIGCRNVGNNHGFVAWQADQQPRFFHVLDDPCDYDAYSFLTRLHDGCLNVRSLRFEGDRVTKERSTLPNR